METKEQKQISMADRELMPVVVIDGNVYVAAEDAVKAVQNARARVTDQRCDELLSVQKQLVEAAEDMIANLTETRIDALRAAILDAKASS